MYTHLPPSALVCFCAAKATLPSSIQINKYVEEGGGLDACVWEGGGGWQGWSEVLTYIHTYMHACQSVCRRGLVPYISIGLFFVSKLIYLIGGRALTRGRETERERERARARTGIPYRRPSSDAKQPVRPLHDLFFIKLYTQ